jgi:uracil-DNA glycosylase family protein
VTRANAATAAAVVPHTRSLRTLARAAASCTACRLHECGTQTVFGEGPKDAAIMLVGEQPGDREDLEGRPFVGPAGRLLDQAIDAAGLQRDELFLTNAVKHFKWRPVGKRRLHERPDRNEIEICKPWLHAEIALLRPACVVALGATAALSLLGRRVGIASSRGNVRRGLGDAPVVVTFHPSSLLRQTEKEDADARFAELVDDLRLAARVVRGDVMLAS